MARQELGELFPVNRPGKFQGLRTFAQPFRGGEAPFGIVGSKPNNFVDFLMAR
jgi:hypothetical protein